MISRAPGAASVWKSLWLLLRKIQVEGSVSLIDLKEKTVELRFGQFERPGLFYRVLRRDHQERHRQLADAGHITAAELDTLRPFLFPRFLNVFFDGFHIFGFFLAGIGIIES